MVKRIQVTNEDGVPVIQDVTENLAITVSVEMVADMLPDDVKTLFLKHVGVVMPEDLIKPGIHDRVLAALRAAFSDRDRLRRITDSIIRNTREVYNEPVG